MKKTKHAIFISIFFILAAGITLAQDIGVTDVNDIDHIGNNICIFFVGVEVTVI